MPSSFELNNLYQITVLFAVVSLLFGARRLLSWTSCGTTSQSIVSSKEEREPFIEPNTLNAALNPTTRHDQRKIIGACCMVTNGKCEGKENDITN